VCCSVLQCAAVCCSVLQCIAVWRAGARVHVSVKRACVCVNGGVRACVCVCVTELLF